MSAPEVCARVALVHYVWLAATLSHAYARHDNTTDLQTAIIEMQFQTLIAGRDVVVPFYGSRRGCTPADPSDFLNAAPGRRVGVLSSIVVVVTALAMAVVTLLDEA